MSVGPAKFDVNRCNESPLRGEKPDFWPVSCEQRAGLRSVTEKKTYKHQVFTPTAGARSAILHGVELVVPIKKDDSFFDPTHSFFPTGCMEKLCLIDRRAVSQQ